MADIWETNIKNTNIQRSLTSKVLLLDFFAWYYSSSLSSLIRIWGNYLAANLHFFNILQLLKSLFSPWHRDLTDYGRGFDLGRYMRIWSLNMVSRGIGFLIRTVTILIGLFLELVILFMGVIFLMFWLVAPAVVALALFMGIGFIFFN
jgi:hypothetical protein